MIRLNNQRYWLYAAVDPATNRLLHVRLFPTRTTALTQMFLEELRERHLLDDAIFLVNGVPWLQAACHHLDLRFQYVSHGNRNAVERVFKELKHRTNTSSTYFRHAHPDTTEKWLQAFAFYWNQLI